MDAAEVIRQLETDAGLRAQLRAVLLGDDVLQLPELTRELAQAQARTEARVEELAQAQARTEARVEELAQAQARTEARVEELALAIGELVTQVGRLVAFEEDMQRWRKKVDEDFAQLKGNLLELRVRQNPQRYLPRRIGRGAKLVAGRQLEDLLEPLAPVVVADVERADAFIEATRPDGTTVIWVAEVAWTAHSDDVERADRRAKALEQAGTPSQGLVVSQVDPDEPVLGAATTRGVVLVSEASGLLAPDLPGAA